MTDQGTHFAVMYRWQVRTDHEDAFCRAWETVTSLLRDQRQARGSRLHRAEDGTWYAYAQWPSAEAWRTSQAMDAVDTDAMAVMREAIDKAWDPVPLRPVKDMLLAD